MDSIIEVVLVLIAISVLFINGISIIIKLIFCTYEVQATVEKMKREWNTDSEGHTTSYTYKAKCSYMYGGGYYTTKWIELKKWYDKGTNIYIHINPNKPKMAINKHMGMYIQGIVFSIVAILIGCAAGPNMYSTSLETYYDILEEKEEKAENERYEKELAKENAKRAEQEAAVEPTPEPLTTMERLTSCTKKEYSQNELGMRHGWTVGDINVATPLWVTGPVFDNENDLSGKATFYYKASGDIYARVVYANHTTTKDKAYIQLRNLVKKQGKTIKFVKKVDKKYRWVIEVYSSYVKKDSDEKKAYDYYAIAANEDIKVIIKHDGDIDECIDFAQSIYN